MLIAALVSAAAHLVLFGFALTWWMSDFGGGGQMLDAIEIEVVDAQALESTTRRGAGGGAAATADTEGGSRTIETSSSAAVPAAAPNSAPTTPIAEDTRADIATAVKQGTSPTRAQTAASPDRPDVAVETPPTPDMPHPPASSTDAGGTAVTAQQVATPAPATAGASPGEVARFKAEVRKTLVRNRPKPGWPAGRLVLAFSVSDTGHVEDVALIEASANARLNQLSVAWIKAIAMPSPPTGLSADDRRYSIPVTIR